MAGDDGVAGVFLAEQFGKQLDHDAPDLDIVGVDGFQPHHDTFGAGAGLDEHHYDLDGMALRPVAGE